MDRLGDKKMINLGSTVMGIGLLFMIIPTECSLISLIGLVILGLGCAPIYPCIIHSTPSNFGAENSGAIIGIQMAGAYTGATFIPPLFGVIGNALGFKIFPFYIALFAVIMVVMINKTFCLTNKTESK